MRITDKTTANNAIYNINEGRIKLDRLNEAISSGRVVNRPSDDPVAAKKILDIESQIKASNQYVSNIKTGKTWLDMAGTSLEGLLDSVMSIRGVAGQALGGLNDPVKKADMLNQLKFFRDQLIDYPSVQVGGQYVFSGFKNDTPPFSKNTIAADITAGSPAISNIDTTDLYPGMPITGPGIPADSTVSAITTPGIGGAITISNPATATTIPGTLTFSGKFNGTEDIVSIEINKGVQVPVGVSGGVILRGGTPPGSTGVDIIKALDTLIADISSDNVAGIQAGNTVFDQANQQMLGAISDVGMRKSRMDNALTSQQRNLNVLSEMHDNMQNVDYAKAAIELTNQKTAFEAALAATAKIAPLSLLNYL
ncbi:MAG: flagellar hook-associated protein FlgL [Pelobacteraceae bacterium]